MRCQPVTPSTTRLFYRRMPALTQATAFHPGPADECSKPRTRLYAGDSGTTCALYAQHFGFVIGTEDQTAPG